MCFQHLGCHRNNWIVDSCTTFNHTTNLWTEYVVLYTAPKEKNPVGLYRGSEGAKRLVRSAQSICLEKFYSEILSL
jgi:hypothetical protein